LESPDSTFGAYNQTLLAKSLGKLQADQFVVIDPAFDGW